MPRQLRWAPKSSNQNPGSTLQLTERETQKGQVSALGGNTQRKFGLEMQQEAVRRGNGNQQHDSSVDFGGGDKYVKTRI